MIRLALRLLFALVFLGPAVVAAQAPERLVFATNWYAQAEHGGFYQAVADPHLSQRGYVTSEPFSIEKGA